MESTTGVVVMIRVVKVKEGELEGSVLGELKLGPVRVILPKAEA